MPDKQSKSHSSLWLTCLAASLMGALLLGVSGCGGADANDSGTGGDQAADEDVPRVRTVSVQAQDLAEKIELPGTVKGDETAELYAKVNGYLDQISVDIGDRVQEDQVLARLRIPEMHNELEEKRAAIASAEANAEQARAAIRQAEAQVHSAEARLEEAKSDLNEKRANLDMQLAEYERTEGLVQRGSLQPKLLDEARFGRDAAQAALSTAQSRIRTAEAEVASAQADVERAETDYKSWQAKTDLAKAELQKVETMLQYGEIRAPFDGVVIERNFDRGAFIQSAAENNGVKPLLKVTRIDVVRIFLDLPMAQARLLNRGDEILLDRINALPGEQYKGEVTRFAPALNHSSRLMRVEIDLENPEKRLLPGYYGYVTLFLDQYPQTPVIPSSALMSEENDMYVFVVEGGICRRHSVKTNYKDGAIVGISSGLQSGQQIVEAGVGQLNDGQKVIAVNEQSKT